jgi:hypothetical protein
MSSLLSIFQFSRGAETTDSIPFEIPITLPPKNRCG